MKPELTAQILGMYIGRPCTINESNNEKIFSHGVFYNWRNGSYQSITPHLRRLESITEEECRELYVCVNGVEHPEFEYNYKVDYWDSQVSWYCSRNELFKGTLDTWLYLLSRGFDLFGLIDSGLAKEVSE